MRYWQVLTLVDIGQLPALAKRAEELGFEGVALGDHLITFETQYQAYDYSKDSVVLWYPETHWPDVWVQIGALSQITTKLKFTTGVYVLPMRDPFTAAKAISTAAFLSNNRVVLGVGVGWQKDEFDLVGQDFHTRGRRTDEMLEILPMLMSGEMCEFHGEFYDFPRLQMSPGVPRVPVIVGGGSPAALKRAARHDGWIGPAVELDVLPGLLDGLKREREALGREKEPFEITLSLYDYSPDAVKRAEDMGVTSLQRSAWLDENGRASRMTLDEKLRDMEAFAERFIR
jgi:probable F420-dependent oxidoreductase